MISCIKDLCVFDLVKECSKCGVILLKRYFHKKSRSEDGLNSICKGCMKEYYLDKYYKIIQKTKVRNENNPKKVKQNKKKHKEQNRETRHLYLQNKRGIDVNFGFSTKTRNMIHKSIKCLTK